jgi:hypothetical protein
MYQKDILGDINDLMNDRTSIEGNCVDDADIVSYPLQVCGGV